MRIRRMLANIPVVSVRDEQFGCWVRIFLLMAKTPIPLPNFDRMALSPLSCPIGLD